MLIKVLRCADISSSNNELIMKAIFMLTCPWNFNIFIGYLISRVMIGNSFDHLHIFVFSCYCN